MLPSCTDDQLRLAVCPAANLVSRRIQEDNLMFKRKFWMLAPALLLAACGQSTTPTAGSEDVPWSYTAPEGQLTALALDPGPNTLSFEPLLSATNGYGPFETDRSNGEAAAGDGKPLTLNGVVYARGFGVHANGALVYSLQNLKGAVCSTFTASIGVDDEVGANGSVRFQVLTGATPASAVQVYDSGVMTGASATKAVNVNVTGSKVLILRVTDAGNGNFYDHADWATPSVNCAAAATPKAGAIDTSFTTPGFGTFARTALSAEGKVIGFGHVSVPIGTPRTVFVRRLDQDGNPDGSFAAQALAFGAESDEQQALVQPDGRILVMGRASLAASPAPGVGQTNFLYLRRLLPGGQPDTSFGNGSGSFAGVQFLSEPGETTALALQPDGKIVIGGSKAGRFLLRRLLSNGQPDATFGSGGQVNAAFGSYDARLSTLAVLADGSVLAGGSELLALSSEYRAVVVKYTPGGSFDGSYGAAGVVEAGRARFRASVQAIRVLPSTQVLIAGDFFGNFGLFCSLRRLNSSGSTDAAFSAFAPGNFKAGNTGLSLAVQADGRAVLGGARFGDAGDGSLALFRFNTNGTLDQSFGTVTDQLGNTGTSVPDSSSVLIQPASVGGKIISGNATLSRVWP
jgi:uncharacterized delta-60 repeat protein